MKKPILRIQNLTKRYASFVALEKISLEMMPNQIYGVIGMSGAGKSTLMRLITGLEVPTEGSIELDGEAITRLQGEQLRKARFKLGMIFQHFYLFSSRNVWQNISYPLEIEGLDRKKRLMRAQELLELVGLKGKENCALAQLSGGEKQRVAIARALAHRPKILLCDEATSALDPRTTGEILALLSKLNQELGLTIFLITHEMEVIKQICTHVAVLEKGKIVEQGETVQLFTAPKHPTTQSFLQTLTHEIPQALVHEEFLLRLAFRGSSAGKPIISQLIKRFDLEVNILLGGIDVLKNETIGNLVISMRGSEEAKSQGVLFLKSHGVIVENAGVHS